MRLSVTQWRIIIVVVNFLLTVSVAGHVVYRWSTPYHEEDKIFKKLLENTEVNEFEPPKVSGSLSGSRRNYIKEVAQFGSISDPERQPVTKIDTPPPPPPPPPTPEGEEEVDFDGPLTGQWEYISYIYFGPEDDRNRAILEKAEDNSSSSSRSSRSSSRSSISRRRTPSRRLPSVRRASFNKDNQRVLFMYGRMPLDEADEDPESDNAVWIVEITPEKIVYEVQNQKWKKHALALKNDSIYRNGEVRPEEEEDEEADAEEEESKKLFVLNATMPSLKKDYQSVKDGGPALRPRKKPDTANKPVSRIRSSSSRSSSSSSTRSTPTKKLSPEEQKKQLSDTLKKLREKKNMSSKDKADLKKFESELKKLNSK